MILENYFGSLLQETGCEKIVLIRDDAGLPRDHHRKKKQEEKESIADHGPPSVPFRQESSDELFSLAHGGSKPPRSPPYLANQLFKKLFVRDDATSARKQRKNKKQMAKESITEQRLPSAPFRKESSANLVSLVPRGRSKTISPYLTNQLKKFFVRDDAASPRKQPPSAPFRRESSDTLDLLARGSKARSPYRAKQLKTFFDEIAPGLIARKERSTRCSSKPMHQAKGCADLNYLQNQ
jgi:hypothetical protein